MKQINIFIASLALTCFAMFPAVALAGDLDDLEVTMEVLDAESDLNDTITEMRGPEDGSIEFDAAPKMAASSSMMTSTTMPLTASMAMAMAILSTMMSLMATTATTATTAS